MSADGEKHTMGKQKQVTTPWVRILGSDGQVVFAGHAKTLVCGDVTIDIGMWMSICTVDGAETDGLNEINARLIAAAPELLQALKALRVTRPDAPGCWCGEGKDCTRDVCLAARAAIAKAEGQPSPRRPRSASWSMHMKKRLTMTLRRAVVLSKVLTHGEATAVTLRERRHRLRLQRRWLRLPEDLRDRAIEADDGEWNF